MNPNTPVVVGDAAAIGALLGGVHGTLIALVIVLSIILIVTAWQSLVLRGQALQQLENLQKQQTEWPPPEVVPDPVDHPTA